MTMERQYKNYAFISYKREDEKWAKWLQRRLENYKLPSVIRKESLNMPQYIRPVFRDKTDLTGGVLADQLRNELERSKYLIVICSPNSAQSAWVNKEAQTFIDEGRTEYIIPFIVDGVPHAEDPQNECFPEVLRNIPSEQELLGINVQAIGREKAFLRLAAYMIGVSFDTLWQRYRRQEKQKRTALAACALVLIGLGIFYWDYTRVVHKYYADYVDCWGVPKGVIELTDEQVSHRERCYQFEYHRIPFGEPKAYDWRLAKVSYINSAGIPQEHNNTEYTDRSAIQKIEYSKESGIVTRINYCNPSGKVVLRHNLSSHNGVVATIADFVASAEHMGAAFIGANTTSMSMGMMENSQRKSKIKRYAYERDDNGYIIKQTFHANNDEDLKASNVKDSDGIFGVSYTLDSLGRRVQIQYLNREGSPHCTKRGVAGKYYEYERGGNICKITYVGLDGNPILNEHLWAICIESSDNNGNVIDGAFYSSENNLCSAIGGYAKYKFRYNAQGNQIETSYFDIDGNPCFNGEGVAKWTAKYDASGNRIEAACFDVEGNPCYHENGYAKWTAKYNAQGNQIETSYFDIDGNPCFNANGIAKWTTKYNIQGIIIETAYFDIKGNPCYHKNGYAKWTAEYDAKGDPTEEAYFDIDGNPCNHKDGYAKLIIKNDTRGNPIEFTFFDVNGIPCYNTYGYAKSSVKYDSRGNPIAVEYFDVDGNPCYHKEGNAKLTRKYDSQGNCIECAYFDIEGKPCRHKDGYAKLIAKFDTQGNQIEELFFDVDDNPYYYKTIKYDSQGNSIEEAYFGVDGNPCYNKDGYAKLTTKYDLKGNPIEVAYFDTVGNPCYSKEGVFKKNIKYDLKGNILELACFDIVGNPCCSILGIAKIIRKYDAQGKLIEESFFDVDGSPCYYENGAAKMIYKYDATGNNIETAYLDIDGNLCYNNEGIALYRQKFDRLNRLIEFTLFDVKGKSIKNNAYGCAKFTLKYNRLGMVVEQVCYNEIGERCINTNELYSKLVKEYDLLGNMTSVSVYDTNDCLCMGADGFSIAEQRFDKKNRVIEVVYYDADRNIITKEQLIYNELGYVVELISCDENGEKRTLQTAIKIIETESLRNIPIGSIIIRCNDYFIGDALETFYREIRKHSKDCYYMTPEGIIGNFFLEKGSMGLTTRLISIDKSVVEEYLQKYEDWGKAQQQDNVNNEADV